MMGSLSFIALAITLIASVGSGAILGPQSLNEEIFIYQQKIHAVYQLLETECPDSLKIKREIIDDSTLAHHLEATKIVYNQVIRALIDCRKQRNVKPKNASTMTSTSTTTPTPTTTTKLPTATDCQELYRGGERTAGIYEIKPEMSSLEPFNVSCEFADGHGWTVIQKRFDGSVDFYRDWNDYKNGFGSLDGEYWLGNDKIHALTQTNQRLNIYVKADNGGSRSGNWQTFHISDETDKYRLTVNEVGYSGDLPQGKLTYHNGMQFSTKDQDNAVYVVDCAVIQKGGWWYKSCHTVNLNGLYNNNNEWLGFASNLVATTMRVTRD